MKAHALALWLQQTDSENKLEKHTRLGSDRMGMLYSLYAL